MVIESAPNTLLLVGRLIWTMCQPIKWSSIIPSVKLGRYCNDLDHQFRPTYREFRCFPKNCIRILRESHARAFGMTGLVCGQCVVILTRHYVDIWVKIRASVLTPISIHSYWQQNGTTRTRIHCAITSLLKSSIANINLSWIKRCNAFMCLIFLLTFVLF